MKRIVAFLVIGLAVKLPALAYEEIKPLNYFPLRYQCSGGYKVSLAYRSLKDIPSGGYGYFGNIKINGKIYQANYYNYGAQVVQNGEPSYPSFSGRGASQGVGTLWLNSAIKQTCVELI